MSKQGRLCPHQRRCPAALTPPLLAPPVPHPLPAVPFTPSQGVCTPSPTNMAAMWVPHPFFSQPAWGMVR